MATEKLNVLGAISAGFLKGMERELRPFNCKLVDFTECSDPEAVADTILQECSLIEQAVEICYDANCVRKRPYVIEQPLTTQEKTKALELDADDVIFVTGGSRGIIHEFIISLFETANPQVVFTGRTPLPDGTEPWLQMTDEWQANALGAAILMPQEEIELAVWRFHAGSKLINYAGWMAYMDRNCVKMMCDRFGVSKTALMIRLRQLGYLEDKSGQYKAKKREHRKSSIRVKVEHVFGVVKGQLKFKKTQYRGLRKQEAKFNIMFALANLILADRPCLAV